jgi:hypothetical protein
MFIVWTVSPRIFTCFPSRVSEPLLITFNGSGTHGFVPTTVRLRVEVLNTWTNLLLKSFSAYFF